MGDERIGDFQVSIYNVDSEHVNTVTVEEFLVMVREGYMYENGSYAVFEEIEE